MSAPRVVLLTRDSPFQRYLASRLAATRALSAVVIESGDSAPQPAAGGLVRAVLRAVRSRGVETVLHPVRGWRHVQNRRLHETYYGDVERHHDRVFGSGYREWPDDVRCVHVSDINSAPALQAIAAESPDLVVVFGTRLVSAATMQQFGCPAVNLHWGWSPDYRGEGIVTALALEGPAALGVTVHLLATGVDNGDVLYQARPTVSTDDNFYAVGLRLTVLGADLIERVITDFGKGLAPRGVPQDLTRGRNRGTRFMRAHPELMSRAWRRLKDGA